MKLAGIAVAALVGTGTLLGAGAMSGAAAAHADKMCGSYEQPVQMPDWYQCDALPGVAVPMDSGMHGCSFIPFPPFPIAKGQPCPWGAVDTGRWP
ncbi:hypothetical protein [Mycobacterium sp. 1274756.6]|uniref:hypothetical protein n=1 Tax=Mycobacterium sp. 1274756.6 TaxID=1834076 RepID=UPI0007FBE02E|nr:hypothetical protein [Mycobacterium sp. 1274756.6]OBJ71097.1 hypothetical protein A5643_08300 [Mycobacterium sp. 1274756.6]